MKIYVFDGIYGKVVKIKAQSMDEAIKIFKRRYPTKTYSCVYED